MIFDIVIAVMVLAIVGVIGVLIHSQKIENYINRKCVKRKNKSR
jgi:uncharacterized membrane protein